MDIVTVLFNLLQQLWYLIPLSLVVVILKSSWFKGVFGEFIVNRLLSKLPVADYRLINDVTLPTVDGTTQIDHIVVSRYGIFVIETKNMKGWIFGSVTQKQWTQKVFRHSVKFQNPLHQNYKHIKTLESLLGCSDEHLHSVIVFVGDSTFKTEMPPNVTYAKECIRYIQQYTEVVYSDSDLSGLIGILNDIKLKRGLRTDIKHRQHVQKIVAEKSLSRQCKRCGSSMVVRKTKRGPDKGKEFWGCSSFPKCRAVEPIG